jgi:hypothetical protein
MVLTQDLSRASFCPFIFAFSYFWIFEQSREEGATRRVGSPWVTYGSPMGQVGSRGSHYIFYEFIQQSWKQARLGQLGHLGQVLRLPRGRDSCQQLLPRARSSRENASSETTNLQKPPNWQHAVWAGNSSEIYSVTHATFPSGRDLRGKTRLSYFNFWGAKTINIHLQHKSHTIFMH